MLIKEDMSESWLLVSVTTNSHSLSTPSRLLDLAWIEESLIMKHFHCLMLIAYRVDELLHHILPGNDEEMLTTAVS